METPRRLAASVVTVPLLLLAAMPAAAAPEQIVYDALGDSYAAGFGVTPPTEACARSPLAYPELLDGRKRIVLDDFAACSGATTTTMAAQLPALTADTDLVTVTIGGNDIGWGAGIVACLAGSDVQCAGALAASQAAITTVLPGLLDATYTQVSAAAPDAHVVVTGYPHLFTPESGDYLGASAAEQQAINDTADLLNDVIADAAARHGFQYVDVTDRFEGHGANSADPWINPSNFHPTAAGQEAYAAALTSQVKPRDLR